MTSSRSPALFQSDQPLAGHAAPRVGRGPRIVAALLLICANARGQATTARVSVDSFGIQANNTSGDLSTSQYGRHVAFDSSAWNLVPDDGNGTWDIFLHDRVTGITERVSVDSSYNESNGYSLYPSVSGDGLYVAFESAATNLDPGDTNGAIDVFVRDRLYGITARVSVDSLGNPGNDDSHSGSISDGGRYVAFHSWATNLVPEDTTPLSDVFVRDRLTGITERVSVDSWGNEVYGSSSRPSISGDGRYVAFQSYASFNIIPWVVVGEQIFVHDRLTGTTEHVSVDSAGNQANDESVDCSISADGRHVAFRSNANNLVPNDTNGAEDVFVHDRLTGITERVSVDSSGNQGNLDSGWLGPSVSANGRYVAFSSLASNLVSGDTNGVRDIFLRDRLAGITERVSIDSSGVQGNDESDYCDVSGDGLVVAFSSAATNLVSFDTNFAADVFVRDMHLYAPTLSFNIDLGVYYLVPWPGFGAASGQAGSSGQAGYWNQVGLGYTTLSDLSGLLSGVRVTVVADSDTGNTGSVPTNEDELLLADHVWSSGSAWSVLFQGLSNGNYVVLVYAPSDTAVQTGDLSVGGTAVPSLPGSPSSALIEGVSWAQVPVSVTDGTLAVSGAGTGLVGLAGLQLLPAGPFASYCAAGVSASGCAATLAGAGTPSASASSGFLLLAATVEGAKDGLFFFGTNGRQANPWGSGTSFQCVAPPVTRCGMLSGTGTSGACDGFFAQDLNALWCSTCPKASKNPGVGTTVQAQLWYRDPLNTSNQTTSLSDANEFQVGL